MSRAPANRTTGLFSLDPMDPCLPLDVLAASQFTDRGPWQKDSTTGPHEPMCAPGWLKDAHFLALVGPWRASAVGSRAELPATPLNRDGSGMWRSGNGTYRARLESHGRTKRHDSQGCRRTTPSRVHGRHLPAGCLGVELGVAPAHPEGDLFFAKHGRGGPSRSGASVPCGRQISAPGPPPRTRAPAPADKHSCVFADSGLWLLAWPFGCVVHEQTRHLVKESFCSQ